MNTKLLFSVTALAAALAGCGGGDINIAPSNTDNSVDNSVTNGGGSTSSFCASYEKAGVTFSGTQEGFNCVYGTDFVDLGNPLTVDVTLPNIGSGAHVFLGSLVVGENYSTNEELAAAGITEGGDGSKLTIKAGSTVAFKSADDYMVINRGSQIFAEGTATDPIVFTSYSDAVEGTVGDEDVSEWGGMIINGFAVTNKCSYTGTRGVDLATTDCNVAAEGKDGDGQTHYGGANDDDNSGVLKYVVVKHTGAEVGPDNELNGISFDAVGRGTTVSYLQAHSTFDDGVEMFGGAVNIDHYVATYVRDDSIDIDEGYIGTFDTALVIQSQFDGNHCIESDGIGSYKAENVDKNADFIARGLNSAATINNLTCIVSPNETGTHDPGAGWRIREGHFVTIENSILTTAYAPDGIAGKTDGNYCVRIESDEGLKAAQDGDLTIESSVIACQDLTKGSNLPNGTTQLQFLQATNDVMQTDEAGQDPTAATANGLVILDGYYSVPVADMVVNGAPATVVPTDGADHLGAVMANDDWTSNWTNLNELTLWFK